MAGTARSRALFSDRVMLHVRVFAQTLEILRPDWIRRVNYKLGYKEREGICT